MNKFLKHITFLSNSVQLFLFVEIHIEIFLKLEVLLQQNFLTSSKVILFGDFCLLLMQFHLKLFLMILALHCVFVPCCPNLNILNSQLSFVLRKIGELAKNQFIILYVAFLSQIPVEPNAKVLVF